MRKLLILLNLGVAFYFIFTELGDVLEERNGIVFILIFIFIILPFLVSFSLNNKTGRCLLEMWPFISFRRKQMEERQKLKSIINDKEEKSNNIEKTIVSLIKSDIELLKQGKIPDKRLIPHHAIKRDIILCAYYKDFYQLSPEMQALNKDDFEKKIDIIKHMGWEDLNSLIEIMKQERDDLKEIESSVRAKKNCYSIVPPIFP